jgi:hypothetical protein
VAVLRENDLANRRPPMQSLTTTLGGTCRGLFQADRSVIYEFAVDRPHALLISSGPFFTRRRVQLAHLATLYKIPAICRQYYCLPRGRRSASSLRASSCMRLRNGDLSPNCLNSFLSKDSTVRVGYCKAATATELKAKIASGFI